MTSNISAGQKVALTFLREKHSPQVEYHVGASFANIVSGHSIHHESCLRDATKFLVSESIKLEPEQVIELVNLTRAAL